MNYLSIKGILFCSFAACIIAISSIQGQAAIIRVPADQPTIQQAINAAQDGDMVLVAPGTYIENIDFLGKAITVTSEAGPQTTIIDGNQITSVVTFRSNEEPESVLSGFTLRNGHQCDFNDGGGITIQAASPTIENNIITNNDACHYGNGIGVFFGSPIIRGNVITNNAGGGFGGGIGVVGFGETKILDNIISNNSTGSGGGIELDAGGNVVISGNVITGNMAVIEGGGLYIGNQTLAKISQNLIIKNQAPQGGGVSWGNLPLSFVNNTISNNDSANGSGMFAVTAAGQNIFINNLIIAKAGQTAIICGRFFDPGHQLNLQFNDVFSSGGATYGGLCENQTGINGNISADPLFEDTASDNYHLQAGSPSIDAGDNTAPDLPETDIDGQPRIVDGDNNGTAIIDMGVDEFVPTGPFNICVQDDSNGNLLQFNSTTGEYTFTRCSDGLTLSGTGTVKVNGCTTTLKAIGSNYSINASLDTCQHKGSAAVAISSNRRLTALSIKDTDTSNNTCSCPTSNISDRR